MSNDERSAAARYLGARGGRATAAKLTPEQRTENARKAGRARAAQRWGTSGAPQLEALAEAAGLKGAVVKVETATRQRRSNNERTLAAVAACEQFEPNGSTSDDIHRRHQNDVKALGGSDWMTFTEVRNALSSLRSKGKVRAVTLPGSRREKLWRLA
jgi:hypothetical protein